MVDGGYDQLSPLSQRSVHVLTSLGEAFPNCATLETMTRSVIRANEFRPQEIAKILKKFQDQARASGNPAILQSSALFALTPLFAHGTLTNDETNLLKIGIALIPPVLAATSVQVNDPQAGMPDDVTVARKEGSFAAIGKEESILAGMKSRGWSDEALKAFKSGKSIRRNITQTGFGASTEENWDGKDQ